jgi:hypothetical protein
VEGVKGGAGGEGGGSEGRACGGEGGGVMRQQSRLQAAGEAARRPITRRVGRSHMLVSRCSYMCVKPGQQWRPCPSSPLPPLCARPPSLPVCEGRPLVVHCCHCVAHTGEYVYDGVALQHVLVATHQVQQRAWLWGDEGRTRRGQGADKGGDGVGQM